MNRPCLFQVMVDTKTPYYEHKPEGPFKRDWCEPRKGIFLQWGLDTGDECGSWSIALVEDEEGRVHEVKPERIQFTDKHFKKVWSEY